MQISNLPRAIKKIWASTAGSSYVRTVPDSGATDGAAAYDTGFPPVTFKPIASGGTPPAGQDFNGVLRDLTAWAQWGKAGGTVPFDQDFANAVGGYPRFAVLAGTTPGVLWQSLVDGNTSNPDAGGARWLRLGGSTYEGQFRQSISAPNTYQIAFPAPFPNACTCVIPIGYNSTASTRRDVFPQLVSSDRNGFSFTLQLTSDVNTDATLDGIDWLARGF